MKTRRDGNWLKGERGIFATFSLLYAGLADVYLLVYMRRTRAPLSSAVIDSH